MQAYASRTGTKRNLKALREAGWGLMISPEGSVRTEGFATYALDNGAWTAYQQERPWNEEKFIRAVEKVGLDAQFVVVPDIVAGGMDSLIHSLDWLPKLDGIGERRLLAVQDGMQPDDVAGLLSDEVGLFLGGSTDWKWTNLASWAELTRERKCYFHVGRVNTVRQIRLCAAVGADSFDGTSASRYAVTLPKLDKARRQAVIHALTDYK